MDTAAVDFSIKPEAAAPSIPTSEWPLLLKNYDKRVCSSSLWLLWKDICG